MYNDYIFRLRYFASKDALHRVTCLTSKLPAWVLHNTNEYVKPSNCFPFAFAIKANSLFASKWHENRAAKLAADQPVPDISVEEAWANLPPETRERFEQVARKGGK